MIILVTGGCGFIGHHFVEHIFVKTNWNNIILDKLTYASHGLERLRDTGALDNDRVKIFTYDLSHPLSIGLKKELGEVVEVETPSGIKEFEIINIEIN